MITMTGPDLVISDFVAGPDGVQITVKNQGGAAVVDDFWVDLYVNPNIAPTHVNQLWSDLGSQGGAWGVTQDLAPGQSVTLVIGDSWFRGDQSNLPAPLPLGATLYAQADSWNGSTTYGAVLEADEAPGRVYNNIRQTTVAGTIQINGAGVVTGSSAGNTLPARPALAR